MAALSASLNIWLGAALLLMLGLIPCGIVIISAPLMERLVALEMAGVVCALILLLLAQGLARPSLYDFESDIRKLSVPALIVVGDEDDHCIEPSLFLKAAIPASGLVMLPKSGHVVNLEEPDLFNAVLGDFLTRVDAGRWPVRDSRSISPGQAPWNRGAGASV